MTPLERGREAAAYFQIFARAHRTEYAELMQGVNPNQGYGNSDDAFKAYDIATMLYHYTDEHFVNCFIPDNYGSPGHFRAEVKRFDTMLEAAERELRVAIDNQGADTLPETIPMVLEQVVVCRYAISETLDQLGSPEPPQEPRLLREVSVIKTERNEPIGLEVSSPPPQSLTAAGPLWPTPGKARLLFIHGWAETPS
jgi:hypothetical protein